MANIEPNRIIDFRKVNIENVDVDKIKNIISKIKDDNNEVIDLMSYGYDKLSFDERMVFDYLFDRKIAQKPFVMFHDGTISRFI